MDRFTDDVLRHVFELLETPAAQAACALTCKHWNSLEREARCNIYLENCVAISPEQLLKSFPGEWTSFSLVESTSLLVEPDFKELNSDSFGHNAGPWLHALQSKRSLTSLTLAGVHLSCASLASFLEKRGATLRHLNLTGVSGVNGEIMALIVNHCSQLQTLSVELQSGSGFSWATTFSRLSSRFSLTHLSSSDWNTAPPALVAPLIAAFSHLHFIDLGKIEMWFFQRDGSKIFSAVAGLRKLTQLKLPFAIGQQDLALFAPILPQIQVLELFDDNSFSSIAAKLSNLVSLTTFGSPERYRQLALWCKRLRRVSFQSLDNEALPLEARGLGHLLLGCQELRELSLQDINFGDPQVANEVAAMQDEWRRLSVLRLSWFWNCKPTPAARRSACQILGSCANLTRLELSFGSFARSRFTADQELELVSLTCKSLRHLKLERVGTSVPGLALIAVNCKGLESLELVQVAVGDVEVAAVAQHCESLKSLRFSECKLSKFAIAAIASGLPRLLSLHIERKQPPAQHVAGTFRQRQFMHLNPQGVKRPFDKVADQFTKARLGWVAESYAGLQTASMAAYPVLMLARGVPGALKEESWLTDPSRTQVYGPCMA